jgi:hypothetical protein
MSDAHRQGFSKALTTLSASVVETAVLLGKSKLSGANYDMAVIQLKLQAEALCRGPAGPLNVDRAIKWLNVCIRNLNQVRSAIGEQHVLIYTAL